MIPEQFTELMQMLRTGFLMLLMIANAILINLWQLKASEKAWHARNEVAQFACFAAAIFLTVLL